MPNLLNDFNPNFATPYFSFRRNEDVLRNGYDLAVGPSCQTVVEDPFAVRYARTTFVPIEEIGDIYHGALKYEIDPTETDDEESLLEWSHIEEEADLEIHGPDAADQFLARFGKGTVHIGQASNDAYDFYGHGQISRNNDDRLTIEEWVETQYGHVMDTMLNSGSVLADMAEDDPDILAMTPCCTGIGKSRAIHNTAGIVDKLPGDSHGKWAQGKWKRKRDLRRCNKRETIRKSVPPRRLREWANRSRFDASRSR